MAVIINGTNGITSVNGTAAAPSVTGTDTDTGIVYGTNTLSLATGGATAVTVNSSGNVGIGTDSPSQKLDVNGTVKATTFSGSASGLTGLPVPSALSTASGSAPSYSARAWVNYNGANGAIRASANVTSCVFNSTGVSTVNITTAMVDANYAAIVSINYTAPAQVNMCPYTGSQGVSSFQVVTYGKVNSVYTANASEVKVAIVR